MRYISAYLLAVLGGNSDPKADDLNKILSSVGVNADAEAIKNVVTALQGKTIDTIIAEGKAKIASVPSGASGASAPAAGGAAPAADSKPAKKEEPKEESDDDMGFGLFD